jgi:hypothetical protein
MTLLAGRIGQLTVPGDGIGSSNHVVIDYTNELLYMLCSAGIRKYSIAPPVATQAPLVSTATALNATLVGAVDSSGNLIVQSIAGFFLNGQPVYKIDPTTLVAGTSFGASTSFPNYPTAVLAAEGMVCLEVNGTPYALIKESANSSHVAVIRTDNMTASGAYIAASSGADSRSFICAGPNTAGTFSTAYLLDKTLGGAVTSVGLYQITINSGAETYNIASWPTPNPFISGGLIGNISAASIDPAFTEMIVSSLGYDSASNIIVATVTMSDFSTSFMVGISPANAAVLWVTPIVGGFGTDIINLVQSRITTGVSGMVVNGAINAVETRNGALTADNVTGLDNNTVISDDVSQLMIVNTAYNSSGASVVPVSGTPSSFSGLALVDAFPVFPPAPSPPGPGTQINLTGPLGGWRGLVGINWLGMALVGDAYSGVVGLSDFTAFTEYGFTQRLLVTSPPIHNDRKRVFIRKFELDIQAATATAGTPDPQLNLEYSKDGGMTWAPLLISRSMGQIGEYTKRLRWLNLGESRSWVLRITVTDPVRRTIIGTYLDLAPGVG